MKYVILLLAAIVLLLPTAVPTQPLGPNDPTIILPKPDPAQLKDTLDNCTDNYRELMADVWYDYSVKYQTFKDDASRLEWLNTNQSAAWIAAYAPFTDRACDAAKDAGVAETFSTSIRNRSL